MIEVQDRVSGKPGRYLMTMEDGSAQYVTLTRADEPTREGTPINKALFDSITEDIQKLIQPVTEVPAVEDQEEGVFYFVVKET